MKINEKSNENKWKTMKINKKRELENQFSKQNKWKNTWKPMKKQWKTNEKRMKMRWKSVEKLKINENYGNQWKSYENQWKK